MGILPPGIKMYFDPELSMPLGAAIPRAIEFTPEAERSQDFCRFRFIEHDPHITEADCKQIKGAAQYDETKPPYVKRVKRAPPSPATPVAVPTFKVGDRVRPSAKYGHASWKEGTITRIDNGAFGQPRHWGFFCGRTHETWCEAELIELILPSEPKADAEWVRWSGGKCPVPPNSIVRVRCTTPWNAREAGEEDIKATGVCWDSPRVVAYRLVKQQ